MSQESCSDPEATCPNCSYPRVCLADPCRVSVCRALPSARCEADLCEGCRAKFFDSNGRDITDTCNSFKACGRKSSTNLFINCSWDNQDSCPGEAYCDVDPFGRFSTCCCNKRVARCPGCTQPVNCLMNPCRGAVCGSFPDAKCKTDYCKGCQPFFFDSHGNNVTDQCNKMVEPCSRNGGRDMNISCGGGVEGACPTRSYCDVDPRGGFSKCCCPERTICGQDPCVRRSCPAYPRARCISQCGRCDPLYIDEDGEDVTRNCYNVQPCSRKGGRRTGRQCWSATCGENAYCDRFHGFAECCCTGEACSTDPCNSTSCPAYPDATCRVTSCDRCQPRFFRNNFFEVTSKCCNKQGYTYRGGRCYNDLCIRGNREETTACEKKNKRCSYSHVVGTVECV